MLELYTFKEQDLKSFKLKERPGLKEMIDNLRDRELAKSLEGGLQLTASAVLSTH